MQRIKVDKSWDFLLHNQHKFFLVSSSLVFLAVDF